MAEHEWPLQVQTHLGDPVTIGGVTLTPQSQAVALRWPNGGFVWNSPLGLLVQRGEETEQIPIVDVTLVTQVALYALAVALSVVTLGLSLARRRT